jgi:hypothetical protein
VGNGGDDAKINNKGEGCKKGGGKKDHDFCRETTRRSGE